MVISSFLLLRLKNLRVLVDSDTLHIPLVLPQKKSRIWPFLTTLATTTDFHAIVISHYVIAVASDPCPCICFAYSIYSQHNRGILLKYKSDQILFLYYPFLLIVMSNISYSNMRPYLIWHSSLTSSPATLAQVYSAGAPENWSTLLERYRHNFTSDFLHFLFHLPRILSTQIPHYSLHHFLLVFIQIFFLREVCHGLPIWNWYSIPLNLLPNFQFYCFPHYLSLSNILQTLFTCVMSVLCKLHNISVKICKYSMWAWK